MSLQHDVSLVYDSVSSVPMWAQTFKNGRRYYREQKGSRGAGYCVGRSGSMFCEIPDEQMGDIISALLLPEAWMDRVLAQVQLADEVKRVDQERRRANQRLQRLGQVYIDGNIAEEQYRAQKRLLEDELASLSVPDVDVAVEAAGYWSTCLDYGRRPTSANEGGC